MDIRDYSTLGALTFLVWESLITYDHEHEYIWKAHLTCVKPVYIFSRYFALCFQFVNFGLVFGPLSRPPLSDQLCRAWYAYQISGIVLSTMAIEATLMIRVFALYNRSPKVAICLIMTYLAIFVVDVPLSVRALRNMKFDRACNVMEPSPEILYIGARVIATQSFVWTLTALKRHTAIRDGWSGAPVLHVMMRDGSCVLAAVCAMYIAMMPHVFLYKAVPHLTFSWPISVLSVTSCRLFINMQRLKTGSAAPDWEFTSCIEIPPESEAIAYPLP